MPILAQGNGSLSGEALPGLSELQGKPAGARGGTISLCSEASSKTLNRTTVPKGNIGSCQGYGTKLHRSTFVLHVPPLNCGRCIARFAACRGSRAGTFRRFAQPATRPSPC